MTAFHPCYKMIYFYVIWAVNIKKKTKKKEKYNFNVWIYNLISVPQITRLLLGDAIILSQTDLHNGSKKEKKKYGKIC